MIAVAGGTGRLGSRVVQRLLDRGEAVRVLSRGGADALPAPVEVVAGDVRDAGGRQRLVAGASVVVSAITGFPDDSPFEVDRDANAALFEVAASAGADVVFVSVAQAAPDSALELARAKFAAEEILRGYGAKWTIVRPDGFVETWTEILEQTAGRSGRPMVFGRGDNPFAWLSVDTVADEVTRAVLDPGLRGSTLTVRGPTPFTLEDLARRVMADHGWQGEPRHLPRAVLHVMGVVPGRTGRMARASLAMDEV